MNFDDRSLGPQSVDVAATVGNFVLRRRDGLFAYQLAVVVDDAHQGVTDVVRGCDLLASTARQILLQQALGLPRPRYLHLPLAVDDRGLKLSKSGDAPAAGRWTPGAQLVAVLEFLGQSPPEALRGASAREVLGVGTGALARGRVRGSCGGHGAAGSDHRRGRLRDATNMATTTKTTTRTRRSRGGADAATESGGKSPRVIRKYPNRRLYDTVESRYVTLADIRRLVVERIDFVVLDRKSQQDITRSILLQVIAEQEGGGESLMSRDFLSQVIRSYGSGLHDFVGRYLDESIQLFAKEQRELRERFKNVVGIDPLETVTTVAQKNYQRWKSLQEEVFCAPDAAIRSRRPRTQRPVTRARP